MLPHRRNALAGVVVAVAADDVADGERQQPLPGLLQRAVEDLVHLVAQLLGGQYCGEGPEQGDAEPQPERQPPLQASWRDHRVSPSR